MTDDLDDVLGPRPAGDFPNRDDLFRRTERRLAASRRTRQAVRAAGVCAVLVFGGWLGWMAKPGPRPPMDDAVLRHPEIVFVPVVLPIHLDESPGPVAERPKSSHALELLAEQSDDAAEVARLYRAAGDAALDAADYANAARCYRSYLARAGDAALSPFAGDSWLLTSLKNAAFKEKLDGPKTDSP